MDENKKFRICEILGVELIENPNLIQHKPRWTKDDVEDAKAVRRILPDVISVKHIAALEQGRPDILRVNYDTGDCFFLKNVGNAFPSLGVEETVMLDEILEAEV